MDKFADTVYYNGTVITMNDALKFAEAVAVSADSILAVGDFAKVKTFAYEKTQYVDLKGKTLLPGFIDAHSHILDTALCALWVDVNSVPLGKVTKIADIEKAQTVP